MKEAGHSLKPFYRIHLFWNAWLRYFTNILTSILKYQKYISTNLTGMKWNGKLCNNFILLSIKYLWSAIAIILYYKLTNIVQITILFQWLSQNKLFFNSKQSPIHNVLQIYTDHVHDRFVWFITGQRFQKKFSSDEKLGTINDFTFRLVCNVSLNKRQEDGFCFVEIFQKQIYQHGMIATKTAFDK